jgi:hypothetical protein
MRKEVLQNDTEKLNGINIISPIMLNTNNSSWYNFYSAYDCVWMNFCNK